MPGRCRRHRCHDELTVGGFLAIRRSPFVAAGHVTVDLRGVWARRGIGAVQDAGDRFSRAGERFQGLVCEAPVSLGPCGADWRMWIRYRTENGHQHLTGSIAGLIILSC